MFSNSHSMPSNDMDSKKSAYRRRYLNHSVNYIHTKQNRLLLTLSIAFAKYLLQPMYKLPNTNHSNPQAYPKTPTPFPSLKHPVHLRHNPSSILNFPNQPLALLQLLAYIGHQTRQHLPFASPSAPHLGRHCCQSVELLPYG